MVVVQVDKGQRLPLPHCPRQPASEPPHSLSPNLVVAQVETSQCLALTQCPHRDQHPRSLITSHVTAPSQLEISQRLALPQRPRQFHRPPRVQVRSSSSQDEPTPCTPQVPPPATPLPQGLRVSLSSNLVLAQVETSQCLALTQCPRQQPPSLIINLVTAQVGMSQRLALPQRPRQHPRSLNTNLVAVQVKMSQPLALPQHPQQPCCRIRVHPPQRHPQILRQSTKVLETQRSVNAAPAVPARRMLGQCTSRSRRSCLQTRNPTNSPLSWPQVSQHCWWKGQQLTNCSRLPYRAAIRTYPRACIRAGFPTMPAS
eukprot:368023-Rhodomonas_salina.2